MIRRAVDILVSAAVLVLSSPLILTAMIAIRMESRARHLPPAPGRPRGRPFDVLKLRTMVDGAEHIGAGLAVNESDPRITRVGAVLRRTSLDELPEPAQRPAGRDVADRPAPDPAVPGRRSTPPRQRGRLAIRPGHHGLGAGQRPGEPALAGADRARPVLHRTPLAARSTADPVAHGAMVLGGSDLYKGAAGGWEGEL